MPGRGASSGRRAPSGRTAPSSAPGSPRATSVLAPGPTTGLSVVALGPIGPIDVALCALGLERPWPWGPEGQNTLSPDDDAWGVRAPVMLASQAAATRALMQYTP